MGSTNSKAEGVKAGSNKAEDVKAGSVMAGSSKEEGVKAENNKVGSGETGSGKAQNWKAVAGVAALVAVIGIFAAIYGIFREKPVEGSKSITIEVVDKEGQSTNYQFMTDVEYLRQAMDEAEGFTFSGAESEYGMMVDTVNGVRADYNEDGAYWSFYVNGEYCNYGIETQPVLDGDVFSIVYTLAQ